MFYIYLFVAVFITITSTVIALLLYTILVLFFTRVPYVDTPKKYYPYVFEELKVQNDDIIYDLGCGDGSLLYEASKFSPRKCVGYEISPWAYLKAITKSIRSKKTPIIIKYENFLKADVENADIVYIFLVGNVLVNVKELLEKKLRKGAKVVSLGFEFDGWEPYKVIDLTKKFNHSSKIYFYEV